MASINITIGPESVTLSSADDAKWANVLRKFHKAYNLGDEGDSDDEKIRSILRWFVNRMKLEARGQHIEEGRATADTTLETEADDLYEFDVTES